MEVIYLVGKVTCLAGKVIYLVGEGRIVSGDMGGT